MLLVMVEDGLYALGLSWAAAAFSFASFLMVLLLIAAGIYFFFRTDAVTGGRWGSRTECRHRIKNMCI